MPTLPPSAVHPENNTSTDESLNTARRALTALDAQRKALESEAAAIVDELSAEPPGGGQPMGVDTPLVDAEGYPRSDVDIYRARELRHRLAEIRTDHAKLMKKIEEGLVKVAAFSKPASEEEEAAENAARVAPKPKPKFDPVSGKWVVMNWDGTVAGAEHGEKRTFHNLSQEATPVSAPAAGRLTSAGEHQPAETEPPPLVPFAVIDSVAAHSPAEAAGLHEGDLVVKFGTGITHANHRNLKAIAELVPLAAGDHKDIPITVLRRRKMSIDNDVAHGVEAGVRMTLELKIRPRPWSGRGLLGCHIKGYTDTTDYKEPC